MIYSLFSPPLPAQLLFVVFQEWEFWDGGKNLGNVLWECFHLEKKSRIGAARSILGLVLGGNFGGFSKIFVSFHGWHLDPHRAALEVINFMLIIAAN